ncbi:MAG: hypothetical protein MSC30_02265 [Gaiellaceae bacterium MAG52_C11]|nr:hypothetical protein [Candidatus Gaiellasilicea maunaloa]
MQQRHALGLLFLFLAACFLGIAISAARAAAETPGASVIALAAAALAAWLASMSWRGLRRGGTKHRGR